MVLCLLSLKPIHLLEKLVFICPHILRHRSNLGVQLVFLCWATTWRSAGTYADEGTSCQNVAFSNIPFSTIFDRWRRWTANNVSNLESTDRACFTPLICCCSVVMRKTQKNAEFCHSWLDLMIMEFHLTWKLLHLREFFMNVCIPGTVRMATPISQSLCYNWRLVLSLFVISSEKDNLLGGREAGLSYCTLLAWYSAAAQKGKKISDNAKVSGMYVWNT